MDFIRKLTRTMYKFLVINDSFLKDVKKHVIVKLIYLPMNATPIYYGQKHRCVVCKAKAKNIVRFETNIASDINLDQMDINSLGKKHAKFVEFDKS